MDPFIGQIQSFGFNFAPKGWAQCNGQLLAISSNTALFSLLGTTYGGNGQTNFALPDLRGRCPLHQGQGPGLSDRTIGEVGGTEGVALVQQEMPAHNHGISASVANATSKSPANAVPAFAENAVYGPFDNSGGMADGMCKPAGQGRPHYNMEPYLVINWCIAVEGIYPSRGDAEGDEAAADAGGEATTP